jgi:hypothetical protein
MKMMMKTVMIALMLLVPALVVAAPDVSGTWTMNVVGGPHGPATMQLTLKQDGAKVSGTFASGHGADMPVKGEFVNGSLQVETSGGEHKVTLNGKLKDDGTMAGTLSSTVGDMRWTASRATDKGGK